MKKFIVLSICFLLIASPAAAFLYDLEILGKEDISKLSDDKLIAAYTEAKIEEKASSEFHEGAGFSSKKDYDKRKDLLRYIIYLRKEMSERKIEADPIDDWLN